MGRKLCAVAAMVVLVLTSTAWAESIKIGFVDIQKALNMTEAGKDAAGELNKELEAGKKKYEDQGQALMKEKENLERQGAVLEEKALQEKVRDFRAKYREWERFRTDTENDIKQRHNEMVDKISKELIEIANKIGQEGGYTLILERSLVPYVDTSLEITDEVIKRHNAAYKKGGSAAGAK